MNREEPLREGQILTGPLFNEPMRVETARANGADTWSVGLVGVQPEQFRRVTLTKGDLNALTVFDATSTFEGDGSLLRLGLQAYALGIAYEFDPCFGLSISRVDPLPHQLEAVYEHLLKLARVRFLLADDAGAGKTIMAGLLIRELKLRGLAERILIMAPANLAFQWQRELKEKFDEKFLVLKGGDIRDQFGVNQWLEQKQVITSLDLAKRSEILPGLRQVHWDLVIVDEAHRMSWSPPARKTARYALGELLRDTSDHLLLLTATPHKGDPVNFTLFLQLLDVERFRSWGFRVGNIHGGMRVGSREEPGTRLHTEQQFREGAIQILVATEAAGEGINLQCCHILFNYDIPWNPNRLEQRMGRIHRYGQKKDCLIFNFVATNTIEGRVLQRLLEKLREIRDVLEDDAVFNVVGEVLLAAHIERVLRDYYAGKLGDADLEERLLEDVEEGRFRAICQNTLEGLASKQLNLEMLMERKAQAQERRVVPETLARFIQEAAGYAALSLKPVPRRLLPVTERAKQLFGEEGAQVAAERFAKGPAENLQLALFPEPEVAPKISGRRGKTRVSISDEGLHHRREATTLDRVHAAMLLEAGGQANALRALLQAEQERGPEFLRLANALSALYPRESEEKRLLDAMLLTVPR